MPETRPITPEEAEQILTGFLAMAGITVLLWLAADHFLDWLHRRIRRKYEQQLTHLTNNTGGRDG